MKIKNAYILIDSCIISDLLSKEKDKAKQVNLLLSDLKKNGNSLYISELTYYEIMRDIAEEKRTKAQKILDSFGKIETDIKKLTRAVKLYEKYKEEPGTNHLADSRNDIDIIIGSLICVNQTPPLLTSNFSDFPRPFFLEKEVKRIAFEASRGKNKGKKVSLYYYLLEANIDKFKE